MQNSQWMQLAFRSAWVMVLCTVMGVVSAQEDLDWVLGLLPDGNDIDINKQLEQGAFEIVTVDALLEETFNAANAWEELRDRNGNRGVANQRYEMRLIQPDLIYTALGTTEYDNVTITVDTERLSTETNDGYGLTCRAEDEENGVYFYISSDGYWRIFAFVDGQARPFMPWTSSNLINQGENATNRITAVCVDDYFALYINGQLAGEASDDTFTSGTVGMSVIVFEEDSEVEIAFDNLLIWQADAIDGTSTIESTTNTENSLEIDQQRAATIVLLEDGEPVTLNNLIRYDDFDSDDGWSPINLDDADIEFDDGILEITSQEDPVLPAMVISEDAYDNVVLQADFTYEDGGDNNAYGLVCRSGTEENGRGYYFLINAGGSFAVWVSDSDSFRFLENWERDPAINTSGANTLIAVCTHDYLAFYANDTLLVDLYDNIYQTGTVGVMVATFEEDTTILVDDFYIWHADLND